MTMLREFFDITIDSKGIFEGLAIMNSEYADRINGVPVIYFTLKGCDGDTVEVMKGQIGEQLLWEFAKYKTLFDKTGVDKEDAVYYRFCETYTMLLKRSNVDDVLLSNSLSCLLKALHTYYGIKPLVLIDEYDQPIMAAHEYGFHEKINAFLASFLGAGLKGNPDLGHALLTGIQRVAKESIFSKLNNPMVCTVQTKEYSEYFGLTNEEVESVFREYGMEAKMEAARAYYDGYIFGAGLHIYNPWSILVI